MATGTWESPRRVMRGLHAMGCTLASCSNSLQLQPMCRPPPQPRQGLHTLMLFSALTFQATFIPISPSLVKLVSAAICAFVAANRPDTLGAAGMIPRREVCANEPVLGGICLVAVPQQLAALQAKVIGRLREPEQLP